MKIRKKTRFDKLTLLLVLALIIQLIMPSVNVFSQNNGESVQGAQQAATAALIDEQNQEVNEEEELEGMSIQDLSGSIVMMSEGDDLGNIFTDVVLLIDNESVTSDIIIDDIKQDMEVVLIVNYEIGDGVDLKAGDWAEMKVPSALNGLTIPAIEDLEMTKDGNKVVVGTFRLGDDNILRLEFNDVMQGLTGRGGEVGALLQFNLEEFEEDARQLIEFGAPINKSFTITAKPGGNLSHISKSGKPNANINAAYIDWQIDVNTTLEELANATVEDIIPAGLELDFDTIEVYELQVGYEGKITELDKVTDIIPVSTENGFKLNLGNTNKAYRIKYKTDITDYNLAGYENNAALKENGEKKAEDSFKIDSLERGSLLEKSGKPDAEINAGKITWQIDVNKAEARLENVSVTDIIPAGLKLVEGSIAIYELNKSGSSWHRGGNVTDNYKGDEGNSIRFPIQFGSIEGKAYRIIFETEIEYGEEYKQSQSFVNEAALEVNGNDIDSDDAEVTVGRDTLLEKHGFESTSYGDPEITWTIEVNKANHFIKDAAITDTIGEGLELRPNSIEIRDHNGNKVEIKEESVGFPYIEEVNGAKFVIKLGDITSKYTIRYVTEITDSNLISYSNKVDLWGDGLKGDGIGAGENAPNTITKTPSVGHSISNSYTKSTVSGVTIGTDSDKTTYDGLDHTNKTMSWVITVDAIKEKITELTITDTFVYKNNNGQIVSQKYMKFLKDTLRVVKGEGILTEGVAYTLVDKGVDGFELQFEGELDRAKYKIYFKTSFDPDEVLDADGKLNTSRRYDNIAVFTGKTEDVKGTEKPINAEDNANYNINQTVFNGGKKDGALDRSGRKITWSIYVNALGQNLTDQAFVITDILSKGQVFDDGSLEIYEYSLNKNGGMTKGEILTGEADYELQKKTFSIDNKGSYYEDGNGPYNGFELTFNNGIDKPLLVEFTTSIEGISEAEYTNQADVDGKDTKKTYTGKVTYKDHDKFVVKEAANVTGNYAYIDDEINWKVTLNDSLSEIENAVFKDTLCSGHVYLADSLKLYKGSVSEENLVPITLDADGEGKLLSVNIDDEGYTHLELKLGDIDEIYIVTYTSVIVAESGVKITNTAALAGFEEKAGNSGNKIFTARQSSWGTGSGREDRGQIQIIKVDKETEETIENNPAQFELYYILNGEKRIVNGAAQTTDKGMLQYGNLPLRTYYLREMEAPEGYVLTDGEPMEIIVDRDNKSIELEIENTKIKMDVTGTKKWVNGELNRPDSIYLQLYQNGAAYGDPVQLIKDNNSSYDPSQWVYTWEDLDKTDIDGKEHIYSVKEVDEEGNDFVPSNYVKEEDGLKVTNTYVIPTKGSAAATKEWADGPSEKPTIWFKLYRYIVAADGGEAEPEEVPGAEIKELADGVAEVVWTGLEETDISGNPYNFLVKEVDQDGNDFAPTNYVKAENGMDVTNYYVSPTDASAKAIKVWENGPSERPTTWFKLYRHIETEGETAEIGEVFGAELEEVPEAEIKELPSGVTEVVWTGLTRTDKYGNEYNFSVKEVDAEGNDFVPESYAKSEDGLTVTNRYVIPEISATGTKVWEGGPKDKPAIELQLYKDGEPFGEPVTLDGTEETPWTYTWVGLEATDINGKEYIYTVDEVETPENYVKTFSEDGLTVTNTYVSPKIEITGNKVWIGAPLEKPDIELQLFRNGEAYGDPVPLKDGATSYTWTDLDLTDMDGVKYVYTIDEAAVPKAYWKTLSEDGLTVINTYDIELDNKVPGGSGSGEDQENGDSLPKTGMVSSLSFYIPGMLLLVLGTLGMFYNRRKKVLNRK